MKKIKVLFAMFVMTLCSAAMTVKSFAETTAATPTETAAVDGGFDSRSLLSFVFMIAIFGLLAYFMIIKPDKKRRKEAEDMRSSIKVGDNVTTIGGIIGTIASISGDTFTLDNGLKFRKTAIYTIDDKDVDEYDYDDDDDDAAESEIKEENK
jgi:preprotein translocase subunit YajC